MLFKSKHAYRGRDGLRASAPRRFAKVADTRFEAGQTRGGKPCGTFAAADQPHRLEGLSRRAFHAR
jgi:hypothetical protein